MINHFENHREITRKDELFINYQNLCVSQSTNVFDSLPLTFQITIPDSKPSSVEASLKKFSSIYEILDRFRYQVIEIGRNKVNHDFQPFARVEKQVF
jgi:hypothetical protein